MFTNSFCQDLLVNKENGAISWKYFFHREVIHVNGKESRPQCISFRECGLVVLHVGSSQCPSLVWALSEIFGEGGLFPTISVHVGQCKRSLLPGIFPTCLLKVISSLSSQFGNWCSAMVSAQGSRAGVKF